MRLERLPVGTPFRFVAGGHKTVLTGMVLEQRADSTVVQVRRSWPTGNRREKRTRDLTECVEWSHGMSVELVAVSAASQQRRDGALRGSAAVANGHSPCRHTH